jgi:hypothetical protein
MQRRQLAATVVAVAMSATSAVIAIGANTGTFGSASPPAVSAPAAAPAPGTTNSGTTNPATTSGAHHDDGQGEREGAPNGATTAAARQGGEHDD